MNLFSKVDQDKVASNNAGINDRKPQAKANGEESTKLDTIKNVSGNVLGIFGSALSVMGGVGAAVFVLNSAVAYFGFSLLITIAGFIGIGILCNIAGSYLIQDNWLERVTA